MLNMPRSLDASENQKGVDLPIIDINIVASS